MKITLSGLDRQLKGLLTVYLIVVTIGVSLGLVYVSQTTSMTPNGMIERYNGSETNESDIEFAESYPKSLSELLTTTHSHILGMSFIFFSIGLIFNFNTLISGLPKTIIMIEPLISLVATFGSIWLIRYADPAFVYLTYLSAVLMYAGFYTIVSISIYELVILNEEKELRNK
ncbi:MAG: hypothetical protein GYA14_15775 [Ignavibacteria bacterium]|nr:hypothetical protein [Ignavibacteria bacterium]